jgi:hypothetical protein
MEFIVAGAPRSANANARSRRRWGERVSRAARERLQQEGELANQDVAVLIICFYQGQTFIDVDNIAKSLLDGLKGVLFRDDQQVSELLVRKSRLSDPEWEPPAQLPESADLLARLDSLNRPDKEDDQSRGQFLLLWSIIEAAARHRLTSLKISPTRRISSSALIKMLLTEGVVEEDLYNELRRGLAVRNAIAHGFLNQTVDGTLFEKIREAAQSLLAVGRRG